MYCEKGVLRNFTKLIGKHLYQSLFFNKVAGLRPATLLKKRLWRWYFPMNFVKLLRIPFSIEHLRCFCHSFLFLLFLRLIFSVKVAIMIAARVASSSKSLCNVKNASLYLKHLALVFENKIIFNSFYIKPKIIFLKKIKFVFTLYISDFS